MLKKIINIFLITLLITSCSEEKKDNYQKTNAKTQENIKLVSTHGTKIENYDKKDGMVWTNFSDGVKKSKQIKRKMFLDFYTDWCTYCKRMDNETFKNEKIYNFMNKNFISIKVNAESNNIVEFNGKKITERELASIFGITSYPTMFFMNSETEAIGQLPGFVYADHLYDIANYVSSNSYKTLSFEEFKKKFKS